MIADHLLMKWFKIVREGNFVNLNLIKLRVCHVIRKITVISEQKKPGAISIESTDGFECMVLLWDKIIDRWVVALSAARADVADGFVKSDVHIRCR